MGPEVGGKGVATTDKTIFTKIITQTNRAGWHRLTSNTAQPPTPSPCLQVGRPRFAWAEAGVCSEGTNTGQEAGGPRTGTGRGPPRTLAQGRVWGHQRPHKARQASGYLARDPFKVLWPPPATLPSPSPAPPASILASKGPVNTGDTSTNDRTSSGGQGDSSCPAQGMAVTPVHCLPSLCGGSTGWGWGTPQQLYSYPGVLQTAAITAHHGDLGLVGVQWLDLKPVFRRGQ